MFVCLKIVRSKKTSKNEKKKHLPQTLFFAREDYVKTKILTQEKFDHQISKWIDDI